MAPRRLTPADHGPWREKRMISDCSGAGSDRIANGYERDRPQPLFVTLTIAARRSPPASLKSAQGSFGSFSASNFGSFQPDGSRPGFTSVHDNGRAIGAPARPRGDQ